jgi:hypothetical protein
MDDALTFMEPATAVRVIRTLDTHSPTVWEDYANLSSAFFVLGETDLALVNARQALAMARTPETLLNLAVILESQGKFRQAFPLSMEAASRSDSRTVQCHATDSFLRMGWFEEAWAHGYSHSHANWEAMSRMLPEWKGFPDLKGKRVLVLPGGGYGDEILFARWLPRLRDSGAIVTYMCMPDFAPLVRHLSHRTISGSVSGFVGEISRKDYDYSICIRVLAERFCPSPDAIPTKPYLFTDPVASQLRRDTLRVGGWPLVGICTHAGEESFPRRHRTLTDVQTERILRAHEGRGFEWVSLNFKSSILPGTLQPAIRNWSDTAAILSALDLVVSVDTGVAHLAGAMGIPCWLLLPGISAAYYGTEGDRCWFYPRHRLFRNHAEGIDNSISNVISALKDYA